MAPPRKKLRDKLLLFVFQLPLMVRACAYVCVRAYISVSAYVSE